MTSDDTALPPWIIEEYIENLQSLGLKEFGTKPWFEFHTKLTLLNRQSIFEINELRNESVKEWLVSFQKIPILIYEAIQIDVWKEKVLPRLIEIDSDPQHTFMIYSIFYHEAAALSLLENVLFHSDSAETLDDSIHDLIDYAVKNVANLVFWNKELEESSQDDNSSWKALMTKKSDMEFDNAMKCISILRYLAEYSDKLPLSVTSRILATHDVPYLLIQLIEKHPWKKRDEHGNHLIYNGKWEKVHLSEAEKLCKIEGQVWIGLRELLLNPKSGPYYELTDFRIRQISKLQKYLHETVLDQIAPLVELRTWLHYLNISSHSSNTKSKPGVCVEVVPQIRTSIIKRHHKKWKKLAEQQFEYLCPTDMEHIKRMAQILTGPYGCEQLLEGLNESNDCALCKAKASKRCSKCKGVWYCGRECQVNDWKNHKLNCAEICSAKKVFGIKD